MKTFASVYQKVFLGFACLCVLLYANEVFARGGGGGSGGGGGGSGGGGVGGSRGGSFSWFDLVFVGAAIIFVVVSAYIKNKKLQAREKNIENMLEAEHIDTAALKQRIEAVFYAFESAWSKFDLEGMKPLLTENYYKRMVLELSVLQNEHRADIMSEVRLEDIFIYDAQDQNVVARISASAQDALMDTEKNSRLFYDANSFVEFWHFIKEDGVWKLDVIRQDTEDPTMVEAEIAAFAAKNNFYFDPDFGWLMLPNKGVLFGKSSFGNSDINNHVIGYFRGKIVEFYTYLPYAKSKIGSNYLVAQTILPKQYIDIFIKKKGFLNFAPWGLKRMHTESVDFDKRFVLFADPNDQVHSLELLTPNFMEKIYNLPFDLNIEVVGNFLYFYTKTRGEVNYDQMLEIISWAFDEMKI